MRRRRRAVKWERGRGRRTALFLVGFALFCVVAFLVLRSTDVFALKRVMAVGAEQVTREQLVSATAGAMGRSLLSLSTAEIEQALLGLPYVESVAVRRVFPDTLDIRLVECRPVARLRAGQGEETWLVSDSGRVMENADPALLTDLPLLVPSETLSVVPGEMLPPAIAGVLPLAEYIRSEEVRARMPAVAEIAVSAAGCAALVLEGGGELRLGTPEGLQRKLGIALDIVQQCLTQGRVIEYVDASVSDRVAVKAK